MNKFCTLLCYFILAVAHSRSKSFSLTFPASCFIHHHGSISGMQFSLNCYEQHIPRSNGKTINNNHQMLTCELVNQFFYFSTLVVLVFFVALSLRCDNMHRNNSLSMCVFFSSPFSCCCCCCFELDCLSCVCMWVCTTLRHVIFFKSIEIDALNMKIQWKITLHSRQEKQSVTIRGKRIKSSACRSTVCVTTWIYRNVYRFFMVVIVSYRVHLLAIHWNAWFFGKKAKTTNQQQILRFI